MCLAPTAGANAAKFAEMARKSAGRGTKNFIWLQIHEEGTCLPSWYKRGAWICDNPFINMKGTRKFRWFVHDFRVFGVKETIRKMWYLHSAWVRPGERIFMGQDENGNKYWQTWDGGRAGGGRWVEPADPHWFRGWDPYTPPPPWQAWLGGMIAHTPAAIQARGEWGPNGRCYKSQTPFNVRWRPDLLNFGLGMDPVHVPSNSVFFSPWSNIVKEAGYARYIYNRNPLYVPMLMSDLKQEIVEDFYRRDMPFCQWNKGQDHDEWRA
jgi:hypothetical protein